MNGPVRPDDPAHRRDRPARHKIDISLILAALVMMLLAVGVIIGVVML